MNIFYLHKDPKTCAEMHNNKHTVKMIIEYAQLLSTAHRVIDGTLSVGLSASGRKKTSYVLMDDREPILYSATHLNHPSAIWARQSSTNYYWLFGLWKCLMDEYTYRYGKVHSMESMLLNELYDFPINLQKGKLTTFVQAMPEQYKNENAVVAYRSYYINEKAAFAKWKATEMPEWFILKDSSVKELIAF